jgi:hypothetical protein
MVVAPAIIEPENDYAGEESVESTCECGNENEGSVLCWETIELLYSWLPLEQCSAQCQTHPLVIDGATYQQTHNLGPR